MKRIDLEEYINEWDVKEKLEYIKEGYEPREILGFLVDHLLHSCEIEDIFDWFYEDYMTDDDRENFVNEFAEHYDINWKKLAVEGQKEYEEYVAIIRRRD